LTRQCRFLEEKFISTHISFKLDALKTAVDRNTTTVTT